MKKIKRISIFTNKDKDFDFSYTQKIIDTTLKTGVKVFIDDSLNGVLEGVVYLPSKELFKKIDLAVILGGDGTIISYARILSKYNIPVFGINLGHLGFLSELEKDNFETFRQILGGEFEIEERMMLNVEVIKKDGSKLDFVSFNDAVISRGFYSRIINLSVYSDDKFVMNYPADGIVISTPTGSTAYSLSAGGPVLEPDISAMCMTPICPHMLYSRPVVFSDERTISVKLTEDECEAMLSVDGQEGEKIDFGDCVRVSKAKNKVRLVRYRGRNFYDVLRNKLSISEEA